MGRASRPVSRLLCWGLWTCWGLWNPALGGCLPCDPHRDGLGWGQIAARSPSLSSRRAAGDGRQRAGMMGTGRGAGPPAAPHPPPGDWCSAFPAVSPLGNVVCVSSWDAAAGRPCHSVRHPARPTGNGWCLQRVTRPKALFLWRGGCREQWDGDQGESV